MSTQDFRLSRKLPSLSESTQKLSTMSSDPIVTTKDVDVGPILNQREAERKAQQYMVENLGWQWNGHWTSRRGTSVIGVQRVAAEQEVIVWFAPGPTPDE